MAYVGREGFLSNTELREGSQHCQKSTPAFSRETLSLAHRDNPLLLRMHSGDDAADNLSIVLEDGSWFIIKRNLRRKTREAWLQEMKGCCKDVRHPREGKTV